jgi:hypothetical protein
MKQVQSRALLTTAFQFGFLIQISVQEVSCEDGRWMELAQDRVQWRTVVLAALNLRVLLPESQL